MFLAGRAMQLLINFVKKLTKKAKKEAIENAPKLHQYYYLPDKKSRNISKDSWNFSPNFKFSYLPIPLFRAEHLTISAED